MRKKLLGLLMAAFAITSISAFAQAPANNETAPCCQNKPAKNGKKGDRMKFKEGKTDLFEGIQLNDNQRQQIDQLNAERKAAKKAAKEAAKNAQKEARTQERETYNDSLAKILTPEQFAQYEANCKEMFDRKNKRAAARLDKSKKPRTPGNTKVQ